MIPKVSIIVPVYKVEKYLDRCLDSLLHQTLKDIEIILVDDGSPDNCPRMCDEYARKDCRVKVTHKINGGLSSARNAGLDIANGEYIAFVDSDDYTSIEAYDTLYKKAKESNADIVYAGFLFYHEDGTFNENFVLNHEYSGEEIATFLGKMIFDRTSPSESICMSMWNGLYKRQLIESAHCRFVSERECLSEDILFHMMFIPLCKKIVCIPKTFYHYCYNGTSLTRSFNANKIYSNFRLYELLIGQMEKFKLMTLEYKIMLLLINNTRGILLKRVFLSDFTLKEKRLYCDIIYSYPGWKKVLSSLKGRKIPIPERIALLIIKYKLFLGGLVFYKLLYSILRKEKF